MGMGKGKEKEKRHLGGGACGSVRWATVQGDRNKPGKRDRERKKKVHSYA